MAKKNHNDLNDYLQSISLLKDVKDSWPEGFANPIIRETLRAKEAELTDMVIQLSIQKTIKKSKTIKTPGK